MARILLGVSGGISAYKAVELARLATKAGHAVRVIQTPGEPAVRGPRDVRGHHRRARARRASSSATRRAAPIPGEPPPDHDPISHLELAARCDAFCIAPATRATRSPSWPTGQADNLLTAAYLACASPVLVAPAMNNHMYEHPATQANLDAAARRAACT